MANLRSFDEALSTIVSAELPFISVEIDLPIIARLTHAFKAARHNTFVIGVRAAYFEIFKSTGEAFGGETFVAKHHRVGFDVFAEGKAKRNIAFVAFCHGQFFSLAECADYFVADLALSVMEFLGLLKTRVAERTIARVAPTLDAFRAEKIFTKDARLHARTILAEQ